MKDKTLIQNILFYIFVGTILVIILFAYKEEPEDRQIVGVHVKGEVMAPGYYEFEYGSRVKDAVIIAGGETEEADLYSLNLAALLKDGEEIKIPSKSEAEEKRDGRVNLNTADLYQLCKLDGIGEATAQDIIDYRNKKGAFKNINELMKVKGIGKSKFQDIKDKIKV